MRQSLANRANPPSTNAVAALRGFAHTRSATSPPTAMHQTLREINHNSELFERVSPGRFKCL